MKTKHYKAIAEAIRENIKPIGDVETLNYCNAFVVKICAILAAENPGKFDEVKFRELLK